eukprot:2592981-Pleurochrysis_carterae.AAC.1
MTVADRSNYPELLLGYEYCLLVLGLLLILRSRRGAEEVQIGRSTLSAADMTLSQFRTSMKYHISSERSRLNNFDELSGADLLFCTVVQIRPYE